MKNKALLILTLLFSFLTNITLNYQKTINNNETDFQKTSLEINNGWITSLTSDKNGTILAGVTTKNPDTEEPQGEIYKSTNGTDFQKTSLEINNGIVTSLTSDKNGTIWAGTITNFQSPNRKGEIYKSTNGTDFQKTSLEINNGWITSLTSDKNGTIWAGVTTKNPDTEEPQGEIYKSTNGTDFQKTNFSVKNIIHLGLGFFGLILISDKNGTIWVGVTTENPDTEETQGEVYKSTNGTDFQKTSLEINNGWITSLTSDKNGTIWAGVTTKNPDTEEPQGEIYKSTNGTDFQKTSLEINNGWITSLISDKNGTIWAGTITNFQSPNRKGEIYKSTNGTDFQKTSLEINNGLITSLTSDKNGTIWAGTVTIKNPDTEEPQGELYKITSINDESQLFDIFAWIFAGIIISCALVLTIIYIIKLNSSYYKNK